MSFSSKWFFTKSRVPGEMMTVPGAACPCKRAARFSGSPAMACPAAPLAPFMPLTTTGPVAMPMRMAMFRASPFDSRIFRDLMEAIRSMAA